MTVTIGINGFGRIGRCTLAHIAEAARNDVPLSHRFGETKTPVPLCPGFVREIFLVGIWFC